MSNIISENIKKIFNDKNTKKALATVDKNGEVHVVFKGSPVINDDGNIELLELIETSATNRNLTNAIWFHKKVAFNILNEEGKSFEIKGYPYRYIIEGEYFEQKYREVRARNEKADLAGVWIIEPVAVKEETYSERLKEDAEKYPTVGHLDRDILK